MERVIDLHLKNLSFDHCPDRRSKSESNKWRRYPADVLPMWVADMDCLSAPSIQQALKERVEHGVFGYGRPLPGLYELLCKRMETKYDWKVDPSWIRFSAGVIVAVNQIIDAVSENGDAVLVQTPAYPPLLETPGCRKLECILSPLVSDHNGRFEIDFEILEKSITDRTRFFLFCNPHNPTGRVFTRSELEKLAEICLRHNLIILSDEIHQDIVYSDHKHIPIASLDKEIEQRTITISSASKTYNIAGLKCAYAIIPNKELQSAYDNGGKGLVDSVNVLGLTATEEAFRSGDGWLKDCLGYLKNNRNYLINEINKIKGIQVFAPEGTFLAWLDCSELMLGSSPAEFFLMNAKIAFNDGATFGDGYSNFVRMNFGCSLQMLRKAIIAMETALNNRN